MRPQFIVRCVALTAATSATALHAAPTIPTAPAALPASQAVPPSQAVLAKDTPIRLRLEHVTESAGHGALGRSGRLTFTCDDARTDDGALIPLSLVVSPGTIKTGSASTAERGASVSTGARGHSYPPDGYYGGHPGGYPGGYYQQPGVAGDVSADLWGVPAGGDDATASRGQQYDARVTASTSLAPTPSVSSPTQLFTLKDKTQVVGALAAFDGQNYTVTTLAGPRSIHAAEVRSIQAISSVPLP